MKQLLSPLMIFAALGLTLFQPPWAWAWTKAKAKATAEKPVTLPDPPLRWSPRDLSETSVTLEEESRGQTLAIAATVQLPTVSSGLIAQANAKNAQLKPMAQESWQPIFLPGRHYFLEIDGPQGHLWCGHRLEIDEAQSARRDTRSLIWEISPRNTRTPSGSMAGATYRIRPHLTVPMLFSRAWEAALQGRAASTLIEGTLSRPAGGTEDFQVTRDSRNGTLRWSVEGRSVGEERLILAPGSGLAVKLPPGTTLGVGLQGEGRNFPCRVPLISGWNLLAYPFPQNLRLGRDWGTGDPTITMGVNPGQTDRILLIQDGQSQGYALWSSPQGPRWRAVEPTTGQWQEPAQFLETIPFGYAFYLFRQKPNPHHAFLPPAP